MAFAQFTAPDLNESSVYIDADKVKIVLEIRSGTNVETAIYMDDSDVPFLVKEPAETVVNSIENVRTNKKE